MALIHVRTYPFQNNDNTGEVKIKIIDSGGIRKDFKCRLKRTTKLRKMMETYANTHNLDTALLRFHFDGMRVHRVRSTYTSLLTCKGILVFVVNPLMLIALYVLPDFFGT